jgi:hypothetical protein
MENFQITLAAIRQRGGILYSIMETDKYACIYTHPHPHPHTHVYMRIV